MPSILPGTVVHINAGVSALVMAILLGKGKAGILKANQYTHNIHLWLLAQPVDGLAGFNGGVAWRQTEYR